MRLSPIPLTAALALCASACAPSLPALLAAQRYDEAICLNDDGHYPRKDDPTLIRAFEALMRPTVKLHVVTQEELDQAFAATNSDVRARAHEEVKRVFVVQTRLEIQATPVPLASADAYLLSGQGHLPPIGDRTLLASFFHEKLPRSHQEGPGVTGTLAAWSEDVAEHPIANALTLGVWSALTGPSAKATTVEPTYDDFRRMAPLTEGLRAAFPWRSCGDKPGLPCESWSIYERPKHEGNTPITLQLGIHVKSSEDGGLFSRPRTCEAFDSVEVKLPTGGTIEERFAAGLGEQALSFSELRSLSAQGRRSRQPRKPHEL